MEEMEEMEERMSEESQQSETYEEFLERALGSPPLQLHVLVNPNQEPVLWTDETTVVFQAPTDPQENINPPRVGLFRAHSVTQRNPLDPTLQENPLACDLAECLSLGLDSCVIAVGAANAYPSRSLFGDLGIPEGPNAFAANRTCLAVEAVTELFSLLDPQRLGLGGVGAEVCVSACVGVEGGMGLDSGSAGMDSGGIGTGMGTGM
ncbi:hypothetical protein B484DRAFT_275257, partial [Ochromonadaceae sp. CCMP2298]